MSTWSTFWTIITKQTCYTHDNLQVSQDKDQPKQANVYIDYFPANNFVNIYFNQCITHDLVHIQTSLIISLFSVALNITLR